MGSRRCPYCGEHVPSFSLNCPKCYRSIPREETESKEDVRGPIPDSRAPSVRVLNRKLIMFLALVPGAVGLTGMGQLYMKQYRKAAYFFLTGFPIFALLVCMIAFGGAFSTGNVLQTIIAIGCIILYIVSYAIQAFDALIRSLFPVINQ